MLKPNLEAAARIELANKDVAGLDLTTWLRRYLSKIGGLLVSIIGELNSRT